MAFLISDGLVQICFDANLLLLGVLLKPWMWGWEKIYGYLQGEDYLPRQIVLSEDFIEFRVQEVLFDKIIFGI